MGDRRALHGRCHPQNEREFSLLLRRSARSVGKKIRLQMRMVERFAMQRMDARIEGLTSQAIKQYRRRRLRESKRITKELRQIEAIVRKAKGGEGLLNRWSYRLFAAAFGQEPLGYEIALQQTLSTLREREQDVLARRFGIKGDLPQTLEGISQELTCTKERIRQIEMKALLKIARGRRGARLKVFITGDHGESTIRTICDLCGKAASRPDLRIEMLDLSVRAYNALKNAGIQDLNELRRARPHELLKMKNFGQKSLREITEIMAKHGLALANCEKTGRHTSALVAPPPLIYQDTRPK